MRSQQFILFLNQDYTEEDEEDEFKVSLFHLVLLLQFNPGTETNEQLLNYEVLTYLVNLFHHLQRHPGSKKKDKLSCPNMLDAP